MIHDLYLTRQMGRKLLSFSKQFPVVALTGPRQSGKSTLLRHLFGKTHRYLTFDDPLLRDQAKADPRFFLQTLGGPAILDEIQYVPSLLHYLKMDVDEKRHQKGKFLLTGSQQFSLMKGLSETLAGRVGLLELLPFSLQEKQGMKKPLSAPLDGFVHSCFPGSFPEIALRKNVERSAWYASYVSTYLERDVRTLHDIGNWRDFGRFLQLLASRTAQILNLSAFASDLGVAVNTVKNWLSILEASRLVFLLPPYYENFGKRITKSPKVYFLDCGLVCYMVGLETKEHLLKGPMAGALFETFCVQETVKTFLNQGKRPDLYYLRTHNGLEVDLLVKAKEGALFPVEIKLSQTPKISMSENLSHLKSLFPKLRLQKGCVLSLSPRSFPLNRETETKNPADFLAKLETFF